MVSMRLFASCIVTTFTLVLTAGCAVGPNYAPPEVKLTESFHAPPGENPGAASALRTVGPWWKAFGDPELTRVVELAGSQSLEIAAARARLQQSRAFARSAEAALFPKIDQEASVADESQSLNSPIGTIGRHLPGFRRSVDEGTLGLSAIWEADLFGGARRRKEAADADAAATAADLAYTRLAVETEAADAYIQIREAQGRLKAALGQEAVEEDLVALLKRRVGEGVSPERELHSAEAALEGVRALIPPLNESLAAAGNRLDVLIGLQPGSGLTPLAAGSGIPTAPSPTSSIRPGDLLRTRPDLVAAERRLRAANARIGAAVAGYYPDVSLSALAGFDSLSPAAMLTGASQESALQAGLHWRLFDFGRIDGEVAQARGREAEALAHYREAVFKATEEVEDSFTQLAQSRAQAAALERRIAALATARRQAAQAYEGGVTSLIEVRDTDRDLLEASDHLAQARAGAAYAAVAAFRSLGGAGS